MKELTIKLLESKEDLDSLSEGDIIYGDLGQKGYVKRMIYEGKGKEEYRFLTTHIGIRARGENIIINGDGEVTFKDYRSRGLPFRDETEHSRKIASLVSKLKRRAA